MVLAARAAGHDVRAFARRGADLVGVESVVGAVEDSKRVEHAAQECQAIIHLAGWVHRLPASARERMTLRASIVDGSRHVAQAARAVSARLILASTVAVYGSPVGPVDEATPLAPDTPYGEAKAEAEAVVQAVDPSAALLRITLVYGPYDRGNMARLMRASGRGLAPIIGGGMNRKSLVYVENLADRILALVTQPLAGVWIASDGAPTQAELVTAMAAVQGRSPPWHLPLAPVLGVGRTVDRLSRWLGRAPSWADRIEKLARSTEFSGAALDRALDYRPRFSLIEGLRRTVAWAAGAERG